MAQLFDKRLLSVVDDLFVAHRASPSSLDNFNTELALLQEDLLEGQQSGTLSESTSDLAYAVSKTVEVVCQTLMNLHVGTSKILLESEKIFEAALEKESTAASPPPPTRTIKKRARSSTSPEPPTKRKRTKRVVSTESASSSSSSSSSSRSSTPALLKRDYTPLYTWLSNNLHDPYPSASVRSDLCRASGGADVERWFTSARRRIGWTELVKRVPGGRERVVSAAKSYWKDEGEEYPGIEVEFALIEKNLKDVYGPRFDGPGEVVKLFGVVPSLKRKRDEEEEVPQQSSKRHKEERPPKTFRPYEPPNLDNWFGDVYPTPEGNVQLEVDIPAPLEAPPITSDLDSFQAAFDTPITDYYGSLDFDLSNFDFSADPSSWITDPIFNSTPFDFGIAVA
ncbi:uncharacterized protein EV420DRAFT_1744636 [Desarmillaria tabescens]|uniref:KN homeodomain domain-containing protein n=1 Tax=Armillaria tabescens TaxID=1929756 RepID=A0AA39NH98_ARMTA|nr:uncharacterized protein EV420DRAFT_1744636 [Desarmillaria tabescens]KAK0465616.1 hypothetical protein EV420DRAFT_1744636 [Desarmillaria tabescens]